MPDERPLDVTRRLRPCVGYFFQGVAPWPFGTSHTDGVITAPSTTVRAHSALLGDAIYVGIGRYLYRSVAVSAGSWGSFT